MAKNMVYTSKRGKQIVFDYFMKDEDEEYKESRPYAWIDNGMK